MMDDRSYNLDEEKKNLHRSNRPPRNERGFPWRDQQRSHSNPRMRKSSKTGNSERTSKASSTQNGTSESFRRNTNNHRSTGGRNFRDHSRSSQQSNRNSNSAVDFVERAQNSFHPPNDGQIPSLFSILYPTTFPQEQQSSKTNYQRNDFMKSPTRNSHNGPFRPPRKYEPSSSESDQRSVSSSKFSGNEPGTWRRTSDRGGKNRRDNVHESTSSTSREATTTTLSNHQRAFQNNRDDKKPNRGNTSSNGNDFRHRDARRTNKRTIVICDGNQKNQQSNGEVSASDKKLFHVGFKYLKEQSEKEAAQIAAEMMNPDSPLPKFLDKRDLQADWLFLLVNIVSKMCSFEFKETRNTFINRVCQSEFLHAVSFYLGELGFEQRQTTIKNIPSFILDLIEFYTSVIRFLPSVAVDKDLPKMIEKTKRAVEAMIVDLGLEVDDNLLAKLDALSSEVEESKNLLLKQPKPKDKQSRLQFLENLQPPDDFRNLDLYPTYEDLTSESFGFVRPNKTKGAYDDEEHYLDVQFRLIREDFVDPLRRGLNSYLVAKANVDVGKGKPKFKYESMRLYPNSCFTEVIKNDKNQLAFVVCFDPKQKMRIKWEYSKRFMYGSLLLFTDDDFTTFFYGTVFNRDVKLLTQGKIHVTFPNDVQADKNLFSKEFLMAESEVFFEPYFLVMKSLKTLNATNFPMVKYIVRGESTTDRPSYMRNNVRWSIYDYEVDPFNTEYWPSPKQLGLDRHQHGAFVKALTSEFCVIQGPPGTGKTFIGLKIVEVLLQNMTLNPKAIRAPLLVVCYTNHALDQFLEGILQYTQKIIRVGGQSRSEILKDYNMRGRNQLQVRYSTAARQQLAPAILKIRDDIKSNLNTIGKLTDCKNKLEKPEGVLKYETLRGVMTEDEKNLLNDGKTLLDWLLEFGDEIHSGSKRKKVMKSGVKKEEDADVEMVDAEAMEASRELEDDDDEEDNELVDEDDVFEMDAATKESLNSRSPYEITLNELAVQYWELVERAKYLADLDDDQIDDFATYQNELESAEREAKILERKYEILEDQLLNSNCSAERMKRIVGKNPGQSSLKERWMIYWNWVRILRENVIQELQGVEEKYRATMAQYDEVKQMEDLYVAQQADVVGMTTTCAARLHTLLDALKPAIVIVEEAAEVLETHIVTSLTKSCQHVILIGDHKQLKPSAAVYKLAKDFKIDVSLFERMINNGMDCPRLNVQHRMRPEISSLISPLIYEDLKDDPSVFTFENIRGMTKNLFFLEHNHLEQNIEDTSSRWNDFEANFMIELCYYLILQGYDPERITILTTYTGQMFSLREKKRERQLMQGVKCIVVDKYQGEENDIILLSLVRSNKEAKIGFLAIENRVCVALSRAKKGLFIVGNMENLAKSSPKLWGNIEANLRKQDAIGREMSLYCSRHEIYTLVSEPKDFDKVREGGCSKFCGELLACGHNCQRLCHPLDREHKEIQCHEPCRRKCAREEHDCKRLCFQDCGKCTTKMVWDLPCGHKKTLPCHVDEKTCLCDKIVDDVLPLCKHAVKRKCHQAVEDVNCPHPCEDRLDCGHACESSCHKNQDPDHLEYKCKKPCGKPNGKCSREHLCEKSCFEECGLCTIMVEFKLKCGHKKNLRCSTDIEKVECFVTCGKSCLQCRQKCRKKCSENCSPCENKVKKIIPECGHSVTVACHVQPERKHCTEMCNRLLTCGHKCATKCRNVCSTAACRELVKVNVPGLCGHNFVRVPCFERGVPISDETRLRDLLAFCDVPCDTLLKCGDPCAGTCGKCWQGRLHQLCKRDCGSVGICGHSCKYPCRQSCPPCEEKCSYRCKHSKCRKLCGVPCTECIEPCDWKCPHKKCTKKCGDICNREPCFEPCPKTLNCGHPCIGFCGEPCPPECRECNKEITEIMFGYEDEKDARFVYLVDCNHTIESRALDIHLNTSPKGGEIVMKVCPLCKTPIAKTLRYMNYVRKTYSNIMKVKRKIFGTENTLRERRMKLEKDIRNLIRLHDNDIEATGLKKMYDMTNEYLRKVSVSGARKQKQTSVSNAELNTIEFFYQALFEICSRLDSLCEYNSQTKQKSLHAGVVTENVIKFVKAMLARIHEPAIQVNEQLSVDVALELQRYHKVVDFSLVLRHGLYVPRKHDLVISRLGDELGKLVFGVLRFDDDVVACIDRKFEELQTAMKANAPLTSAEKRMLNQVMFNGRGTGHWYVCSNGHPYAVTECGRARQRSNCPECGVVIGGERLTSDFDGA